LSFRFWHKAAQPFAFAKHGAGARLDSAWEQEKPEARKMLEKPHRSPVSSARFVGGRFRSGVVFNFNSYININYLLCAKK
jgi:hypothetical protein